MSSYNLYWQPGFIPSQSQAHGSQAFPQPSQNPVGCWSTPTQPPHPQLSGSETGIETEIYFKILNPACKKEGEMHVLRGLSPDFIDSPDKLKHVMATQYGDHLPSQYEMEIGYFLKSNKLCIRSRLDVNDVWGNVKRGEKVTLWCVGAASQGRTEPQQKRKSDETSQNSAKKVKKGMSAEEKKAAAQEYEQKLLEKHANKYSRYQIKFWSEMLANGGYSDIENPPAGAAMFSRETGQKQAKDETTSELVNGMMTMVNTLCQALVPQQISGQVGPVKSTFSPIRKAELRGTYFKQLGELGQLFDAGILTEDEYKEQKQDIIDAMRKLK